MALDFAKLEQVRRLPNGDVQTRCPACAEADGDKTGNHLRVYASGAYGCCVHPQDREHTKRIFALAGDHERPGFRVNAIPATAATPSFSIKASLLEIDVMTETDIKETECPLRSQNCDPQYNPGTPGTAISQSRTYAKEASNNIYKDRQDGVPSVPAEPLNPKMPFLKADGTLCIPFDSAKRYHWWQNGQSVTDTMAELQKAPQQATAA